MFQPPGTKKLMLNVDPTTEAFYRRELFYHQKSPEESIVDFDTPRSRERTFPCHFQSKMDSILTNEQKGGPRDYGHFLMNTSLNQEVFIKKKLEFECYEFECYELPGMFESEDEWFRSEIGEMDNSPRMTMHDRRLVRLMNERIVAVMDKCLAKIASVNDGDAVTVLMTCWRNIIERIAHSAWPAVWDAVRVRPYALHWQEVTQQRLCAPGGDGRAADQVAFEQSWRL